MAKRSSADEVQDLSPEQRKEVTRALATVLAFCRRHWPHPLEQDGSPGWLEGLRTMAELADGLLDELRAARRPGETVVGVVRRLRAERTPRGDQAAQALRVLLDEVAPLQLPGEPAHAAVRRLVSAMTQIAAARAGLERDETARAQAVFELQFLVENLPGLDAERIEERLRRAQALLGYPPVLDEPQGSAGPVDPSAGPASNEGGSD